MAYVLLGTAGLLAMVALISGAYLAATRQYPLLVVMVTYTLGGIALLLGA